MRCDNCEYCRFDDDYWYCALHLPYEDDKNGDSGCKYNKKTLDKRYKKQMEEQERECQAFCEFCKKEEE